MSKILEVKNSEKVKITLGSIDYGYIGKLILSSREMVPKINFKNRHLDLAEQGLMKLKPIFTDQETQEDLFFSGALLEKEVKSIGGLLVDFARGLRQLNNETDDKKETLENEEMAHDAEAKALKLAIQAYEQGLNILDDHIYKL